MDLGIHPVYKLHGSGSPKFLGDFKTKSIITMLNPHDAWSWLLVLGNTLGFLSFLVYLVTFQEAPMIWPSLKLLVTGASQKTEFIIAVCSTLSLKLWGL